ncbi:MAG: riboflavin synthase [Pseudomonadota bacterium]|nr:riboflavin synthase [Pseudomonadota bacterium]
MFTGIISDLGTVKSVTKRSETRIVIDTNLDAAKMAIGASICCSGACLTIVDRENGCFSADVSNETLSKTTIGSWNSGTKVNLEQPLRAMDELGGHIVSGHVDGLAKIVAIEESGDSLVFSFRCEDVLRHFIAAKGSVAIDGVSLTVNKVLKETFTVNIIPHTQKCTTFGDAIVGEELNLEIDQIARYVGRLLEGVDYLG